MGKLRRYMVNDRLVVMDQEEFEKKFRQKKEEEKIEKSVQEKKKPISRPKKSKKIKEEIDL